MVSEGGTYTAEYYPVYSVTIKGYVIDQGEENIYVWKDENWEDSISTPYEFTGLYGTHTFWVQSSYASGAFKQWSTGETSQTLTVTQGGTYTAQYYKPDLWSRDFPTQPNRDRRPVNNISQSYCMSMGYVGNVVWSYVRCPADRSVDANFDPKVVHPNNPNADTSTVIVSTTTQSEPGTYMLYLEGAAMDAHCPS